LNFGAAIQINLLLSFSLRYFAFARGESPPIGGRFSAVGDSLRLTPMADWRIVELVVFKVHLIIDINKPLADRIVCVTYLISIFSHRIHQ